MMVSRAESTRTTLIVRIVKLLSRSSKSLHKDKFPDCTPLFLPLSHKTRPSERNKLCRFAAPSNGYEDMRARWRDQETLHRKPERPGHRTCVTDLLAALRFSAQRLRSMEPGL